jgi:hypothetical protein
MRVGKCSSSSTGCPRWNWSLCHQRMADRATG